MAGLKVPDLIAWIARAPNTDVALPPLLLSGGRCTGKSLLLEGIAQLMGGSVSGGQAGARRGFNGWIIDEAPFVRADVFSDITWGLLRLIYTREHEIQTQCQDARTWTGYVRLACETNDPAAFLNDVLTMNTLHVAIPRTAGAWWGNLGADPVKEIAQHCAWIGSREA